MSKSPTWVPITEHPEGVSTLAFQTEPRGEVSTLKPTTEYPEGATTFTTTNLEIVTT